MAASVEAKGSSAHLVEAGGAVLDAIVEPGVNLCVWSRPCPPWAASLEAACGEPFEQKHVLDLGALHVEPLVAPLVREPRRDAALDATFDALSHAIGALADDVRTFARRLGTITGRDRLEATLSVLHADGCKKLHVDEKGIRLLCTYVGPSTEWAPNDAVDRAALSSHGYDFERANESILRDRRALRPVERGWVALLKGEGWPGNRGNGVVHRSPPIADRGLRRLVLAIDANP